MDQVRVGIIGAGNIGQTHIKNLLTGAIPDGKLTVVADRSEKKRNDTKEKYRDNPALADVTFLSEGDELIESGLCDLVVVAVPHYDHPVLGIRALKAGRHILVEKPAGVYTKQVRELNEEAERHPDQIFGIMFNQRTNPYFKKMKKIIADGELGEIKRTSWIITDWYRAQTYYDSGDWRATWSGEGGGVLFNQAPHNIDLFWWITGMMPRRVHAFCHFGKWHDIEVEDDVTAYFEYDNGATGTFITTTGDCPGSNRFEITGTRGKLVYEDKSLTFTRLEVDEREYNLTATNGMKKPPMTVEEIVLDEPMTAHAGILQNVCAAILKKEPLYARGEEGICGVELGNAMLLSSWQNKTVTLPLDEKEYFDELQKRVATSRRKTVKASDSAQDLDGTY